MRRAVLWSTVLVLAFSAVRVEALSIAIVPPGTTFRSSFSGLVSSPIPETSLLASVGAAASYWEGLLLDDRSLTIEVGFARLPTSTLAEEVGTGSRTAIGFNPTFSFFVDSTPFDASEYADPLLATFADLGAGPVNSGLILGGATGDAAGRFDLFSVALHEIGHSLGLDLAFEFSHGDQPIVVDAPLPFSGSQLPYSGGHLALPSALMSPNGVLGARVLASDVDILAIAEAGSFTNLRLNDLTSVPEPASAALTLSGILVLGISRRSRDDVSR